MGLGHEGKWLLSLPSGSGVPSGCDTVDRDDTHLFQACFVGNSSSSSSYSNEHATYLGPAKCSPVSDLSADESTREVSGAIDSAADSPDYPEDAAGGSLQAVPMDAAGLAKQ